MRVAEELEKGGGTAQQLTSASDRLWTMVPAGGDGRMLCYEFIGPLPALLALLSFLFSAAITAQSVDTKTANSGE